MSTKAPNNPFLVIGYHSKRYFCNRNTEVRWLRENIENERNSVLYSWRRLGKTAVIHCVLKELEREKKAETVYADLLATQYMDEAVLQIAQAVIHRFGKTSARAGSALMKLLGKVGFDISVDPMTGMPSLSMGVRQGPKAEHSLQSLGEFLASRNGQVVIAIDEFQQVTNYDSGAGEAIFRTWAQQFPTIRFIFSGSHRQMMTSMFTEKKRPFYRSSQLMELKPIEIKEYRKFINRHFKAGNKSIAPIVIDEIYNWSRGQTYCIQLLCNRLYAAHDNVEPKHLPQVIDEILEQEHNVFSNYFSLFTKTQWNVLRAVAKEEPLINPLSKEVLSRRQLGAASTVKSALTQLQQKEFVIKDDDQYLVHDVIFARWLQSRK